jgi:hypothetical protein
LIRANVEVKCRRSRGRVANSSRENNGILGVESRIPMEGSIEMASETICFHGIGKGGRLS